MRFNFENKSGVESEVEYLGVISERKYIQNVKDRLREVLIAEKLSKSGIRQDPKEFLRGLRSRNPEAYKEIVGDIDSEVDRISRERVVSNRHIFLRELSVDDQLEIIENSQAAGFDACDPDAGFANDLHSSIVAEMGAEYEDLEYYPAGGSHLDYCGVDAFLKFKYQSDVDDEEGEVVVFIDITTNTLDKKQQLQEEKRQAGARSLTDIVLSVDGDYYQQTGKERSEQSMEHAKQIINIISQKIESQENSKRKIKARELELS